MLERLVGMLEQLVVLGQLDFFLQYEHRVRQQLLHGHKGQLGFLRECRAQLLESSCLGLQH